MDRRTFLKLAVGAGVGMSLTRMLLAARGGSRFVLPVTPGIITISSAPDGAWLWIHEPRAIHYNGYVYIGYVDSSGNVCLKWHRLGDGATSGEIILHAALDYDDHVHPSFLVRASDHKLMTWYGSHVPKDASFRQRISTTSLDTDPTISDGFAAEQNFDSQIGSVSYNYPSPFQLSNGDIHVYYRTNVSSSSGTWRRTVSTDGGASWSPNVGVFTSSYGYIKPVQNGDRLDFVCMNSSPNVSATGIGHFYWENDAYYTSDGTEITTDAPPLAFASTTLVHAAASGNSFFYDIAIGSDGYPRIVYAVFPNGSGTSIEYWHGRWTGTEWVTAEIIAAGSSLSTTHPYYANGIAIDPDDVTNLWVSSGTGSVREISKWTTADEETWSETVITSGSTNKNFRPYKVPGTDLTLWLTGTYTTWDGGFNVGIKGYR